MKKLLIALIVLGLIAVGISSSKAESTRTTPHKFRAFSSDTEGLQGATIYRITGYATGNNSTFAIHNVATLEDSGLTTAAVEGGEATSGDALPHMYFGENGITLDTGLTVDVASCVIVIEYL